MVATLQMTKQFSFHDKNHDEDDEFVSGKPAGQVDEVELPNSEVLLLVDPLYYYGSSL